ncbi:rhomboid family intramembrane serine protease [Fervidobacterium thailandense]|uniref:Rhomboid family intramembrane serine protease n=1 Tax=Fervidobacterium thailandense TaxID=1008305 RepID=A0A1E3G576_9BACT|nr:rhomboid family intramembrane serine protease [Fervidobacterium thailandense]ODN31407.1 rhomboid family intramembrane serine protease [Fervidobacterium thailandense]
MFPLYDTIPHIRKPYVNYMIIVANVLVFAYELYLSLFYSQSSLTNFFNTFGFVPAKIFGLFYGINWRFEMIPTPQVPPLAEIAISSITHMFIHGGWFHIIGNMWFLKIFGDNVEDAMGHFKFFIFYITGGLFALAFHVLFNPFSDVPLVGASGAISAVMGAYAVLFWYSRIVSLVFLIFPIVVEIPAVIYLFYWFLIQVINGFFSTFVESPVAYWAHAGGFIYGLLVGTRVRKKRYWF